MVQQQDQESNHKQEEEEQDSMENQKIYPHQLSLSTLFTWFIGILNGKAWEYLGLMMNPETKEVKQDLKKAKTSIDSIEFLFHQIREELKLEDQKQLENILANLQMNYVEIRKNSEKAPEKKEDPGKDNTQKE